MTPCLPDPRIEPEQRLTDFEFFGQLEMEAPGTARCFVCDKVDSDSADKQVLKCATHKEEGRRTEAYARTSALQLFDTGTGGGGGASNEPSSADQQKDKAVLFWNDKLDDLATAAWKQMQQDIPMWPVIQGGQLAICDERVFRQPAQNAPTFTATMAHTVVNGKLDKNEFALTFTFDDVSLARRLHSDPACLLAA
jgi:hypothetical protein